MGEDKETVERGRGMGSTIRKLSAMAVIAATSSAMAETPNNDELRACLTAAMTSHVKTKAVFFASNGGDISKGTMPQLTIEYFMALRRLDETYCLEYARCVVAFTKPAANLAGIVAGTQFSGCLTDEAKEGAEEGDNK
jgi:hypothetical protein